MKSIIDTFRETGNIPYRHVEKPKIICWWSGGVTSAVACYLALKLFGDRCLIVMIDTKNEHEDTYRFKKDCEKWYGQQIHVISRVDGVQYDSIKDVWLRFNSLNVAHGAICSSELKRTTREQFQKTVNFEYQVFGFEFDKAEFNRAKSMKMQHKDSRGIYPLLMYGYDKKDCIEIIQDAGIEVPLSYKLGFGNNNCLGTGCVQGGIGYWQKMEVDFPDKFDAMADMEHLLTDRKGKPVTMLKDQSKAAKESGNTLVFLKKHPDYPNVKCLADMPKCPVKPLMECNGFCGTNDLNKRNETESEINFEDTL